MILRDGRREVHNLGPRRTFQPSLMTMIAGSGETTGSGGWNRDFRKVGLFQRVAPRVYTPADEEARRERVRELNREARRRYRKAHPERNRADSKRYRDRKKQRMVAA